MIKVIPFQTRKFAMLFNNSVYPTPQQLPTITNKKIVPNVASQNRKSVKCHQFRKLNEKYVIAMCPENSRLCTQKYY